MIYAEDGKKWKKNYSTDVKEHTQDPKFAPFCIRADTFCGGEIDIDKVILISCVDKKTMGDDEEIGNFKTTLRALLENEKGHKYHLVNQAKQRKNDRYRHSGYLFLKVGYFSLVDEVDHEADASLAQNKRAYGEETLGGMSKRQAFLAFLNQMSVKSSEIIAVAEASVAPGTKTNGAATARSSFDSHEEHQGQEVRDFQSFRTSRDSVTESNTGQSLQVPEDMKYMEPSERMSNQVQVFLVCIFLLRHAVGFIDNLTFILET